MGISIIIPAYNVEGFLRETVESVVGQSYTDWELLIVNDGSTDGTLRLAEQLAAEEPRIRVLNQANAGVSRARNHGAECSAPGHDLLIFLDGDDVWEPDALASLQAALAADPAAIGAHAYARVVDEQGSPLPPEDPMRPASTRNRVERGRAVPMPPDAPTDFAVVSAGCPIINPGVVLLRREAFQQSGGFDETMSQSEDADMWLRLARLGHFAFTERIVMRYRRRTSAATANAKRQLRGVDWYYHKSYHDPANTPEQRRLVMEGYRALQRRLGKEKLGYVAPCLSRMQPKQALLQLAYGLRHLRKAARIP